MSLGDQRYIAQPDAESLCIVLVVVVFFAYGLFVILRQRRLSEIQRDFINNMAHEIRTPLATITVSAQTLRDPGIVKTPERLLNYSTIIMEEAVKMKNQLERVLSVADSESRLRLNVEEIDINGMIRDISDRMIGNHPQREIAFTFLPSDSVTSVLGDRLHISNLLFNLLDNAVKYSSEKPEITVSIFRKGANIEIHVSDNGYGISKEDQRRIFDKFYRVPTGNTHNAKGFGIGLSYVTLIAKAHKGSVTVSSRLNAGSTFIVTLPA